MGKHTNVSRTTVLERREKRMAALLLSFLMVSIGPAMCRVLNTDDWERLAAAGSDVFSADAILPCVEAASCRGRAFGTHSEDVSKFGNVPPCRFHGWVRCIKLGGPLVEPSAHHYVYRQYPSSSGQETSDYRTQQHWVGKEYVPYQQPPKVFYQKPTTQPYKFTASTIRPIESQFHQVKPQPVLNEIPPSKPQRPAPQFDEHQRSWINKPARQFEERSQQIGEAQRSVQPDMQSFNRPLNAMPVEGEAQRFVETKRFSHADPVELNRPPRPAQTERQQQIAQVIQQNAQSPMRLVEAGQLTARPERTEQFFQQVSAPQRPVEFQERTIPPVQNLMGPQRSPQISQQPVQQPMEPQRFFIPVESQQRPIQPAQQLPQVTQRPAEQRSVQPVQNFMEPRRLFQESQQLVESQQRPVQHAMEPQRFAQKVTQRPIETHQPAQQVNPFIRQPMESSTILSVTQQRQREPVQPPVEPQRIAKKTQRPVEQQQQPIETQQFIEPAKNSLENLFQLDPTVDRRVAQEQLATLIQLLSLSASQSETAMPTGTFPPSIPDPASSPPSSNVVPFIAFSDPLPLESNNVF